MSLKIRQLDDQEPGIQNIEQSIPKNSKFWIYCVVGKRGAGKSNVILNLLEGYLKKYYTNIYLISPTAELDPKFEKLVDELKEDNKFFDKFSESLIEQLMERLRETSKKERNLIIFDDCIADLPASFQRNSNFNRLITGSRHFRVDIVITAQKFNKLSTLIRNNLDILSIFPTQNRVELRSLLDNLDVKDENMLIELLDKISYHPHEFLTINFMKSRPRYYLCLDEELKGLRNI